MKGAGQTPALLPTGGGNYEGNKILCMCVHTLVANLSIILVFCTFLYFHFMCVCMCTTSMQYP